MALRIAVNRELEALDGLLAADRLRAPHIDRAPDRGLEDDDEARGLAEVIEDRLQRGAAEVEAESGGGVPRGALGRRGGGRRGGRRVRGGGHGPGGQEGSARQGQAQEQGQDGLGVHSLSCFSRCFIRRLRTSEALAGTSTGAASVRDRASGTGAAEAVHSPPSTRVRRWATARV